MKYNAEVHLINGKVLHVAPLTQAEADNIYAIIGSNDGRLTLPFADKSAYLISANQVNYITLREAA